MAATSRSSTPRRYVALGDSFTAGALGSSERSYADQLADLLRAANGDLDYSNLAVAGARTPEVVSGQLGSALALRPDVVTLVCGANDALLAVRPDVRAHVDAFDCALRTLRTELPEAVVATATTPDPGRFLALRPRSARRVSGAIERINEATRAVAARHGVACLDFAAHPEAGERVNYADDGYHPSAVASRRAAEAFASVLGVRFAIQFDNHGVM
jgi:lysophospholipase L1-like esterase